MKIFFYGRTINNSGPDNVNKRILENLTPRFRTANCANKYLRFLEALWKIAGCGVVVVSGVSRKGVIFFRAAKLLGKKTVYIMHGCGEYEARINGGGISRKGLLQERYLLEQGNLLLPVSKKFMQWVQERYPQYASKTGYLYNGIDRAALLTVPAKQKIPGSIAAVGGLRKTKNNQSIARAVEAMGGRVTLDIYGGRKMSFGENLKYVRCRGNLPNEVFLNRLAETELFVLNSIFEPFSLSAVEALLCGCSVLISNQAGIVDILALEDSDIIFDPMDEKELRSKMEYLLEHPNHDRIASRLDLDECSYERRCRQLEQLCLDLVCKDKLDREQTK